MVSIQLGFHYHIPALRKAGKLWMPGFLGLFVESLATECERVVCFMHTPSEHEYSQMDYPLQQTNIQFVDIGPHAPVPKRTIQAYLRGPKLRSWQNELDVLLVRAPTPLLPVLARYWQAPMSLLIVGDYLNGIEDLPQPRWRRTLIQAWAIWNKARQTRVAFRSLTFVNNRLLYDQYAPILPHLVETRTTTLREGDIVPRFDTCEKRPVRLLYTGRLTRLKGILETVRSLAELVESGEDIVLDLVGMPQEGDPLLDELIELAIDLGVRDRVQYHGYKRAGNELLAFYRKADIYVIASHVEGFPRTIWEAMASGVPVIATKVGSIPSFIGDSAILIPPKNVPALTKAVQEMLSNPVLRQKLIKKGLALARLNTLEKQTGEMVSHIKAWLPAKLRVL